MNGLLPIVFCAAAAALVGGALVCYLLRGKLPRRKLLAVALLPALLAAGTALIPFLSAFGREKPRDWQVLKERRASDEELKLLRESFPGMTGQADREIYHRHYGRFMLAITGFENEAGAEAFRAFRSRQTGNLHLCKDGTHIEVYGRRHDLNVLVWAEFKPDPLIRRCAALVAHGVLLRWILQEPESSRDNVRLLYKIWTNYGYVELLLPVKPSEVPDNWFPIPGEPEGRMMYVPYPDAPDLREPLLEMMRKPVPEHFCPPEILRL